MVHYFSYFPISDFFSSYMNKYYYVLFYSMSTTLQIILLTLRQQLSRIIFFYCVSVKSIFWSRDWFFSINLLLLPFSTRSSIGRSTVNRSIDMRIYHDHTTKYLERPSLKGLSIIVGYHDMSGAIFYNFFLSTLYLTNK